MFIFHYRKGALPLQEELWSTSAQRAHNRAHDLLRGYYAESKPMSDTMDKGHIFVNGLGQIVGLLIEVNE